jgi:hypothetical protein
LSKNFARKTGKIRKFRRHTPNWAAELEKNFHEKFSEFFFEFLYKKIFFRKISREKLEKLENFAGIPQIGLRKVNSQKKNYFLKTWLAEICKTDPRVRQIQEI